MDRGQGAFQAYRSAEFLKGEVGLEGEFPEQGLAVGGKDDGFAAGAVVLGTDVGKAAALLKELFNHAKGDVKAAGSLALGAVVFVVGS